MISIDFHFHGNITGLSASKARKRLNKYVSAFNRAEIDYIVSTEHSYKDPLKTFYALSEASADSHVNIVPGVESVSKEGIDIIYIFRNEDHFKSGLRKLHSFSWSVEDIPAIRDDIEAITIIPHPFFISKASFGTILGMESYLNMVEHVDYIETNNGSALKADQFFTALKGGLRFFKRARELSNWTLDLPMELRGRSPGWSVGSDAHCPAEFNMVGITREVPQHGEDIFDFLKRRIRFTPYVLIEPSRRFSINSFCILRSLGFASTEYSRKELVKLRYNLPRLKRQIRMKKLTKSHNYLI